MSRQKHQIWTTAGDSDEDVERIVKSFYKSDFFVDNKLRISDMEEAIQDEYPASEESEKESYLGKKQYRDENIESEDDIGPRPIYNTEITAGSDRHYGSTIMKGNTQIQGEPVRTTEEIERYESLGYVMRNKINNVTLNIPKSKKEAQKFSQEEKRALAIFNLEEQQRKENNIINQMKSIWQSTKDNK
jgi:hypothetical protein